MLLDGVYAFDNLQEALGRSEGDHNYTPAERLGGIEASLANDSDAIVLPTGRVLFPAEAPPNPASLGDGGSYIFSPKVDPEVAAEFELAVRNLLKRGKEVAFLITPYHPVVMDCKNPLVCETLSKVEAQIRLIAARLKLRVIGSFDPAPFKLTWQDFIDDMHLGLTGVSKVKEIDSDPWVRRKEKQF